MTKTDSDNDKKVAKLEAAARILILLMKLNKWKQIKAGYDFSDALFCCYCCFG